MTSEEPRQWAYYWAGMAAALLISLISIRDPDLPWHLSAARQMLSTHAFAHRDFLSWTAGGRPWLDFEWGSELIFYGLNQLGGTAALWLTRAAALGGLTLLMLALLRRWHTPKSWDALAAPAFTAALFPLFGVRPEMFSLLFFLLQFHILERRRLGDRRLSAAAFAALHVPLYVIWANLHAGFVAGLILCASYGLGELTHLPDEVVPAAGAAAAAGFAGTLVNPYGAALYGVLVDHWMHMPQLQDLINEWARPDFLLHSLSGYWPLVLFSFAGILLDLRQGSVLPPEHVAALLVFGVLGSRSTRSTVYTILVVYPLGLAAWNRTGILRRRAFAAAAACMIAAIVWRGGAVALRRGFYGWPKSVADPGPRRAIEFLGREKSALSKLRLYNTYSWGGFIGYALAPDYKVFIDGRYIFIDLLATVDAAQRNPKSWMRFIEASGVQLALTEDTLLMVRYPWDVIGRPFSVYTWPKKTWALVYWGDGAMIFVRRATVPAQWLNRHEYKLIYPKDLHHLGLLLISGRVKLSAVDAEILRYRREIGAPDEVAALESWRSVFAKELASPARR